MWQVYYYVKNNPKPNLFYRQEDECKFASISFPEIFYLLNSKYTNIIKIEIIKCF